MVERAGPRRTRINPFFSPFSNLSPKHTNPKSRIFLYQQTYFYHAFVKGLFFLGHCKMGQYDCLLLIFHGIVHFVVTVFFAENGL